MVLPADISKDRPGRLPLYIMLNALIVIVVDHHVLRPQHMEDKTFSDAGVVNSYIFFIDIIYGNAVYLSMLWEFIELPPFAELRDSLFSDEEFLALQEFLCNHPEAGDVIPSTGGCRKLRWAAKGKVKRGGARVIYFLRAKTGHIILVAAYGKGERDDVPRPWLKRIKEAFEHEQS